MRWLRTKEAPRVGVYICHCGGNISDTVDIESLKKKAATFKGVKIADASKYVCSNPGQNMIKKGITEQKLNRIVVVSCSPRMHLETFRRTVESTGLNPYLLEMVNIREQCSWIHGDIKKATNKAIDIVRGAVERAYFLEPLEPKRVKVVRDVLVIGGGVAGINTAIELADNGYKVNLVEKSPSLGGHMAQLSKTFPTLDCSSCILTPKMVYASQHPKINIISMAEVASVEGSPGNYRVRIVKNPRYLDENNCTACGDCAKECPVKVVSEFEQGLEKQKAISIPFPQAIPNAYFIDKRGIPTCKAACPAGVNVQGYIALIREGKFSEALKLIRKDNPLPLICGRVCFHQCETECERGSFDEPVAINFLKRFLTDWELEHGEQKETVSLLKKHQEKIAIIGSGPAGLTAAHELVTRGYMVTIYESSPKPGGMLRTGIPEYRLPKKLLESEIKRIQGLGVKIRTNITVGKDITIEQLKQNGYKAILLAIGAQKSRKLGIKGENLQGVVFALQFLKDVNLKNQVDVGERVVVVGGGNVAVDAARSAIRLGAKDVKVLYRRSSKEMPAYSKEANEAKKEGVKFQFLVSPKTVLGENEKVAALKCIRTQLGDPDKSGRRQPLPVKDSEFVVAADTIIIAVGETPDISILPKEAKSTMGKTIDPSTLGTVMPGVFAAGDAISDPATVIDAIASGKQAGVSIDNYLRGTEFDVEKQEPVKRVSDVSKEGLMKLARQVMPALSLEQRVGNFQEVTMGLTEEMAVEEASRCLNCGGCCECLECEKVCEVEGLIDHNQRAELIELDVGAIIVATGFDQINPKILAEYSFGKSPDIITNLQFERLMIHGLHKPSDGKMPKKVAFVLCVGSRMLNEKAGEKHCCKIGCMTALKQALLLQKTAPDAEPWIFYLDMRADGKGYEEFYMTAQEHGVKFVRGRVSEISPTVNGVLVKAEDTLLNARFEGIFDLVVLSSELTPNLTSQELSEKLGVSTGSDGFFLERHYKFRPVDSQREGIYVCGCALGPKDVRETTLEAMATALRTQTFLGSGEISLSPEIAYVIKEKCNNCNNCVEVCPVKAIEKDEFNPKVNPISCVGCGICLPSCPCGALNLNHCSEVQLLAQIRGISKGKNLPRIIAFVEGTTAYASLDLAGQTRMEYSPLVKIIRVPSTGRVGISHLLTAFGNGADGIIFVEGKDGVFKEEKLREHVIQLKKKLRRHGINPLRLVHTITTIPQYDKILNVFDVLKSRIDRIGPIKEDERMKIEKEVVDDFQIAKNKEIKT